MIIVGSISWSPLTLMVNLQHWPNVGQTLFSKLTLTNMWNHTSLHILRGMWVGYVKVLFISTSLHYYWLEYELDLTTDFAVYLSGLKNILTFNICLSVRRCFFFEVNYRLKMAAISDIPKFSMQRKTVIFGIISNCCIYWTI